MLRSQGRGSLIKLQPFNKIIASYWSVCRAPPWPPSHPADRGQLMPGHTITSQYYHNTHPCNCLSMCPYFSSMTSCPGLAPGSRPFRDSNAACECYIFIHLYIIVWCPYLGVLGHLCLVTGGAGKLEEGVDREPGGEVRPVLGRGEGDAAHTLAWHRTQERGVRARHVGERGDRGHALRRSAGPKMRMRLLWMSTLIGWGALIVFPPHRPGLRDQWSREHKTFPLFFWLVWDN